MAQQLINIGTFPNDATGDPARTAFTKINNNFTQLFGTGGTGAIFGPPAAGVTAVTVNGATGATAMVINNPNVFAAISINNTNAAGGGGVSVGSLAGTQVNALIFGQAGLPQWTIYQPAAVADFRIAVNTVDQLIITSAGNVVLTPPTSGVALTVGGGPQAGGITSLISNTSAANLDTARIAISANNTNVALYAVNAATVAGVINGGPVGAQSVLRNLGAYPLVFGTNNNYAGQIDANQLWTVNGVAGSALTVGGNAVTGTITASVSNTSTTAGDQARQIVISGATQVALVAGNAATSVAIVTGGPVGAQSVLRNLGAYPLVFGVNNTYAGQIAANGAWQIVNVGATNNSSIAPAGVQASFEFAGNGNTVVTSSMGVGQTAAGQSFVIARGANSLVLGANLTQNAITITPTSGGVTFSGSVAMNGNTPYAGSAGWGTPTGGAVVINYPGASATLAVTSSVVANLIAILKNFGLLAA